MNQPITSAATSLKQVPAILRLIEKAASNPHWIGINNLLDYGGGKYDLLTRELAKRGVNNLVYDPFNRSEDHNEMVRWLLKHHGADAAICSNVLNVIRGLAVRRAVLQDIKSMTVSYGEVFFTVYEGDGSSVGRKTSKGWQANRPTKNYLREIRQEFTNVKIIGKLIVARGFK